MTTFQTPSKLKKEITSTFPNKIVKSINGVDLINRNDLCELKVSNKYVNINTYTPVGGHRTHFFDAPFNVEFLQKETAGRI